MDLISIHKDVKSLEDIFLDLEDPSFVCLCNIHISLVRSMRIHDQKYYNLGQIIQYISVFHSESIWKALLSLYCALEPCCCTDDPNW